jgi:archaemetzincin
VPISILNGSALHESDLRPIASTMQAIFADAVGVERAGLDFQRAYDSSRRQHNSTALLAQILQGPNKRAEKKIAIVDVDLFIPVLTFVFGEAQLGGTAAIVSTHRLSNEYYGLAANPRVFLQRLEKEIVHEVGHTFGLYHCRYFECVMRSSTYVEEIDLKRAVPCAACAALLAQEHLPMPS